MLQPGFDQQQLALIDQASVLFPGFGKNNGLDPVDPVLQLHESHLLPLLRHDQSHGNYHADYSYLTVIRQLGQQMYGIGLRFAQPVLVSVQRMPRQIQAQQLLLHLQLLHPGIRLHVRILDSPVGFLGKAKQVKLQIVAFLLPLHRRLDRFIQDGQQLGAMAGQRAEGTGLDQRFDNTLVADPQIHAATEIEQILERPLFPCFNYRFNRLCSDILDGGQPEADAVEAPAAYEFTRVPGSLPFFRNIPYPSGIRRWKNRRSHILRCPRRERGIPMFLRRLLRHAAIAGICIRFPGLI
ncbi:Uncharacterised protein [Chlamydia abortus]|nr:Uncharacterised protein [Chlamydia abortus]